MRQLKNKFVGLALLMVLGSLSVSASEVLSVEAFNQLRPQKGEFVVEGYLVGAYRCPACPKGAQCQPCFTPDPSITISSLNHAPTSSNYSEDGVLKSRLDDPKKYLVIDAGFVEADIWKANKRQSLALNQKYKVTVTVRTKIRRDSGISWRAETTWQAKEITALKTNLIRLPESFQAALLFHSVN